MIIADASAVPALGLAFVLGLRHGLDPDHIAVIDNLAFQAADERPGLAPWVGSLFAAGHSLSVAAVAVGVALFVPQLAWPAWAAGLMEWGVVGLLVLVGSLNLAALNRPGAYAPTGWRRRLVPAALSRGARPWAIVAVGVVFGLVFDTAAQAAAWGLAAGSSSGVAGAAAVAGAFAAGMILTDTADSQIVAALLRRATGEARIRRYRRGVGWVIVAASFGMAAYAVASRHLTEAVTLSDTMLTALGAGLAAVVIAALAGRRRSALT